MRAPIVCLSTQTYPPEHGGVAVAASRLARTLADAGYVVHVVTTAPNEGPSATVHTHEGGIEVHRLCHPAPQSADALFALRQLITRLDDKLRFDLFHGFFLFSAYPCLGPASRPGQSRPLIASARGSDVAVLLDQPPVRALLLPVLRRATWITSVNQELLDRIAEEFDIRDRSSVIHNGVEEPSVATPRWSLDAGNRGVVGIAGQFRKVKDIPLLVRAYARVPAALRRRLVLAGYFTDAEEAAWSTHLIQEMELTNQVEETGAFDHAEVHAILRRMHVYVQCSGHEGLPNALLEAASLGVPLVATAVGGMKEVLTDGESALLVPHGDPVALGNAITRVLGDDGLAARLSAGAAALTRTLSPATERQAWLALYARVVGTA